ncbi:hypothetical protein [Pedobacter sp. BMA]|uniref:hypothetical protein n=1 Tax=Pedobacter sp. BMA TaxID=1663685 RepID=UPI00064985E5|nr:hypothetical protein [Pedobacter sp. BMA]KLT63914.1 hypothetical protein AB669_19485 [Pedobacter sp. BMA]
MENNSKKNYAILNLPIKELAFSENFKLRSKLMGFFCLNDILSCDLRKLHEREDYSERFYYEFIRFLTDNDLSHALPMGE